MHRMAQKATTSASISCMAKKVTLVPTVADGQFAVSKVSAAHFIVLPANPTAFQDSLCCTHVS